MANKKLYFLIKSGDAILGLSIEVTPFIFPKINTSSPQSKWTLGKTQKTVCIWILKPKSTRTNGRWSPIK